MYFNEFKELKYLNGVQNFLLNYSFIWVVKTFKQNVLSLKSYLKGFSSLTPHSKKGLPKVHKISPKLDPNLSHPENSKFEEN
jgi:hypothetical protein